MKHRCFVILPYRDEYAVVYSTIVESARELGCGEQIEFVRADREALAVSVQSNIQRHVFLCDLAIADVSDMNPNVLYEIGYAAALEKPVVLLAERSVQPPLSLQDRLVIRYDRADLRSLASQLPSFLSAVLRAPRTHASDTFVAAGYSTEYSAELAVYVRHARTRIDCMVTDIGRLLKSGLLREISGALRSSESLGVRIMALDPDSAIVNMRARQLSVSLAVYRESLRSAVADLAVQFRGGSDRCSLRLFDDVPYCNVYQIDEIVFLGQLFGFSRSRGGIMFKLGPNDPGVDSISGTFDATWEHSQPMVLREERP